MGVAIEPNPNTTRLVESTRALVGLFLVVAGVVVFICLKPDRHGLSNTIYPWSAYVFAAALVVSGVVIVGSRAPAVEKWVGPAAAVAVVSAMQLGGLGVVAIKHWEPAFGMGGGYGNVDDLVHRAWVLAAVASAAGLAALLMLIVGREFTAAAPTAVRWGFIGTGLFTLLAMPLLVGAGSAENRDATSLGAYGLIFGLPWGIAFIMSAWLRRLPALGLTGAVLVSALFALAKAWMVDLIFWRAQPVFLVVVGIAFVMFFVRFSERDPE